DVLVLAGDIHTGTDGIAWAGHSRGAGQEVIYVPGNHEFYGNEYHQTICAMEAACATAGVHLGHRSQFVIGSVRFVCATLWTDFELFGRDSQHAAMDLAAAEARDFELVGLLEGETRRRLRPQDTLEFHRADLLFLDRQLGTPFAGRTVVVTHFLPSRRSVADRFEHLLMLNAYFASALDRLIEDYRPVLWIHGHTHERFDYSIGPTRIVCNPRGYPPRKLNRSFDPGLVIEI
ncbi:MAG: metallophosphoesterase, partial [Alphaproteobacteria bacterium]|nr:metallophosphoesterase [Alphaproteobacteria bacterium]